MLIFNRFYREVEGEYYNVWKSGLAYEVDVQKGNDKMERYKNCSSCDRLWEIFYY